MAEKLATGYVELTTKGTKKAERDLERLNRKFKQTGGFASSAGAAIAAAFSAAAVVQGLRWWVAQIEEGQAATAKLNAVLKATGNTTGSSSAELEAYAAQLQQVTRFGDEATTTATAFLATIESLGGSQLKDAIRLSQDLATVLGTDLDSAARMMGRALADPAEGLSALQRVGVKFTQAQRDQIKAMVDSGKQAEAQAMILSELEKRFGGAAEAARDTFGGALEALKNSLGDLSQEIATGNDGPLRKLIDLYREEADALAEIIRLQRERAKNLGGTGGASSERGASDLVEGGEVESLETRRKALQARLQTLEASRASGWGEGTGRYGAVLIEETKKELIATESALGSAREQRAKLAAEKEAKAAEKAEEERLAAAEKRWMEEGEAADRMAEEGRKNFDDNARLEREQEERRQKALEEQYDMIDAMNAARQRALDEEIQKLDEEAEMLADFRDRQREAANAPFNQMLEDRMNQRGSRMGVASLEAAIQQSLLTNKDIIPKQQLDELKNANRGLKAIDKNLEKVNQFGAGAVA